MAEEPQFTDAELKKQEVYSSVQMSRISETEGEDTGEDGPAES